MTAEITRWTSSEVGGLNSEHFVVPQLIRYETFDDDEMTGEKRTIPAFYYKPQNVTPGQKLPVIITIHGGPGMYPWSSMGWL